MNWILSVLILWLFSFLWVTIDDMCDNVYWWVRKKLNGNKEIITRFDSTQDIHEHLKNGWFRDKYLHVYRFFNQIKNFPNNTYYEIKWFVQRGVRGYSDRDLWEFDGYLSRVIKEGCIWLRMNQHGVPILCGYEDYEADEKQFTNMKIEWAGILWNMIDTFSYAQEILDARLYYQPSRKYSKKRAEKYNKIWIDWKHKPVPRAMTKEKCKRYEEGWKLFQQHFFDLWD